MVISPNGPLTELNKNAFNSVNKNGLTDCREMDYSLLRFPQGNGAKTVLGQRQSRQQGTGFSERWEPEDSNSLQEIWPLTLLAPSVAWLTLSYGWEPWVQCGLTYLIWKSFHCYVRFSGTVLAQGQRPFHPPRQNTPGDSRAVVLQEWTFHIHWEPILCTIPMSQKAQEVLLR